MKFILILQLTIALVASHKHPQADYFWREYYDTIPEDAAVVGRDTEGKIYIGQGYYRDHGLCPGRIIPGAKGLAVPWGTTIKISKFNKILCGPSDKFYWMEANATHLYQQVANKHPVVGGHDDIHNDYFNIGKITTGGSVKIGEIASFWRGNAFFYYIDGPDIKNTTEYEILMYKNNDNSQKVEEDVSELFDVRMQE